MGGPANPPPKEHNPIGSNIILHLMSSKEQKRNAAAFARECTCTAAWRLWLMPHPCPTVYPVAMLGTTTHPCLWSCHAHNHSQPIGLIER
uniref:Uncharacterized protein n=1 Tax=Ditylenchus dipsaci TaxID=166011 RepID=A0A915D2Z4_9BILA